MRTLVVSDLHLDPVEPSRYQAAIEAIDQFVCDHLVLAGDIFEAWIGDDGADDLDCHFLESMGQMAASVEFIPGNRDFLVTEAWLQQFGIAWRERIQIPGGLILHGDELCTDDTSYQAFRNEVRTTAWQSAFLSKSLDERQAIAKDMRDTSQKSQANRPEAIGDAVDKTIEAVMTETSCDLLIHGHTHRPAVHRQQNGLRVVTSDWNHSGIGCCYEQNSNERRIQLLRLGVETEVLEAWSQALGTPEWKRNS